MTAQPRRQRNREPGPADLPRNASGPPLPEDDIAAATTSRISRDSHGERLAYSVDEAARLTGLSRDLPYDQIRLGNLAYVKVGRQCLIIRQHLQQFLGITA
jgi:excisionase family DNA binding protein